MLSSLDSIIFFMPPIFTSFFSLLHPPPLILATSTLMHGSIPNKIGLIHYVELDIYFEDLGVRVLDLLENQKTC